MKKRTARLRRSYSSAPASCSRARPCAADEARRILGAWQVTPRPLYEARRSQPPSIDEQFWFVEAHLAGSDERDTSMKMFGAAFTFDTAERTPTASSARRRVA
jgi:hypothetical protein